MNIFAKVKTVVGATGTVFAKSILNADMLVEEISFSPKVPKLVGYANVAAQAAARNATFIVMAKPRDKRAWKVAIAANAVSCVTATACYLYDKENYEAATLRYVGRCLETGDEFANTIVAVKEAA